MKKTFLALSSLAIIITLGIGLSSCKDDEKPSKANVSFTSESKTIQETAGTIEVKVSLDRAASTDIIVQYELSGTALPKAGSNQGDYTEPGDAGEVTILKGATTGSIQLDIVDDLNYEVDETIIISLTDIASGDAVISADDETEVIIQSDDLGPKASFTVTTMTVNEADVADLLEIEVTLDKAASQNINIQYELSGTAVDSISGFNMDKPSDYYIDGESGVIPVAAGETTGKIFIQLMTDFYFEDDETIIITLKASDGIQVGSSNKLTITLQQQDGIFVLLEWGVGVDENYPDVDMDLFLWAEDDNGDLGITGLYSAFRDFEPEFFFLPEIILADGTYGLSCTYNRGTADPMNFVVSFIEFANGELGTETTRNATYHLANINASTQLINRPLAMTFEKSGSTYSNFSEITVNSSSSREGTSSRTEFTEMFKSKAINTTLKQKITTPLRRIH